jgi:hypothetical protein
MIEYFTFGLDVVTWQNVDPVGGMLGGYFERYIGLFTSGLYSLGMMLYIDYYIMECKSSANNFN